MRTPLILGAAAVLALGGAGCSKKDDAASTSNSIASGNSAPATSAATLSKDDFIKKADAICKTYDEKIAAIAEPKSEADVVKYFKEVIEPAKAQMKELRALGDPPADADLWKTGIGKQQEIIDRVEELLKDSSVTGDQIMKDNKIEGLDKESKDAGRKFGLKVCVKPSSSGSGSGSTSTTGAKKTTTTTADSGDSSTSTTEGSGGGGVMPDQTACLAIATANLDLTTATETATAEKAAAALRKYSPPSDVDAAIQVMVEGPGIQVTDNGKTANASKTITAWVDTICKNA